MEIKDLAVSKELSHEERAALRGGTQLAVNFGGSQSVAGAVFNNSPITLSQGSQTSANYNAPTIVNVATITDSVGAGVWQLG
jgi:hypothetical protein